MKTLLPILFICFLGSFSTSESSCILDNATIVSKSTAAQTSQVQILPSPGQSPTTLWCMCRDLSIYSWGNYCKVGPFACIVNPCPPPPEGC